MAVLSQPGRARKDAAIRENLALLDGPENMLCSFPRSGSYWLRSMLYDCVSASQGHRYAPRKPAYLKWLAMATGRKISPKRPVHLGFFSPQVELPDFQEHFTRGQREQRVVKTHLPMTEWASYAANKKILVLFRNPADCLVSAYKKRSSPDHQRNKAGDQEYDKAEHVARLRERGIDGFALRQVEHWLRHADSFLEYAAANPGAVKFVAYETLKRETEPVLTEIAEFYGLPGAAKFIRIAVANRDIAKVKKKLASRRESININTGRIGDADRVLDGSTLAQIETTTASTLAAMRDLAGFAED